jgi:CCR4-NOT transcription complex subunit 10
LVDPSEMDLRDSSSSSSSTAAANANRDGSSGTDDDAVLSVATALAKDAALHFQSSKFAECVEVLNQLLLKKEHDPKVSLSTLSHTCFSSLL